MQRDDRLSLTVYPSSRNRYGQRAHVLYKGDNPRVWVCMSGRTRSGQTARVLFKGPKMVLKLTGDNPLRSSFVVLRSVLSKRVVAWTVWLKRADVLRMPRQGAQGGGG